MYKIYQVEYGDDLDKIAFKVGSTIEELENINGLNGRNIMVGELIIVPNKNNMNEVYMKYQVKKGDTLYTIAKNYELDMDTLSSLNGLNKEDYIYPNQELIIPKENVQIYLTKKGDTIKKVLDNFNTTLDILQKDNNKIYLEEDQVIIYKRDN